MDAKINKTTVFTNHNKRNKEMKLNLHRPFKGMKGEDIQNKEGHVQLMDEVLCEILFAGSFIRPSGDTDQDARRKMRAFELYQKLSQATLEGSEGSVYEGYWDSLVSAYDALGDEDPVMVRLRLYQLIYEAISSPTYLNGFRRAGVTEKQAHELLENVLLSTAELSDDVGANEKSQEMYDEIVGDVVSPSGRISDVSGSAAYRNINTVYGSAGAQAETGSPPVGDASGTEGEER